MAIWGGSLLWMTPALGDSNSQIFYLYIEWALTYSYHTKFKMKNFKSFLKNNFLKKEKECKQSNSYGFNVCVPPYNHGRQREGGIRMTEERERVEGERREGREEREDRTLLDDLLLQCPRVRVFGLFFVCLFFLF